MIITLKRTDDPRHPLKKVRRKELERFAEANNITSLTSHPQWPNVSGTVMREILAASGVHSIPGIPERVLGQAQPGTAPPGVTIKPPDRNEAIVSSNGPSVSPEALLMQEWKRAAATTTEAPPPVSPYAAMGIAELRKECRAQGVPLKRTDKAADMRAKLDGKNAS